MWVLKIKNLEVRYGSIVAISDISLEVEKGKIVTIIGANGAGKTTLVHTISGLLRPKRGSIKYEGREITQWSTDKIVAAGIAQVPEGRQIFGDLTVLENLMMGAFSIKGGNPEGIERAFEMFPRLKERASQKGGSLSGGEQQMLAFGRALMCNPKLLLLDEPSMGLAPIVVTDIFKIIKKINEQGITVVLIEQNAKLALAIADYGYVIENGRTALSGTAKELAENPRVQEIYLGG
ncbi:MAG: ABC transporter ATP-binding protein [Caldicoprobacterales bacterium]|nr:ABC transporter ATP-binding protein [Clostridiales bacterium]